MTQSKFDYLGDKNWNEITRDERTFCAHLYEAFRQDPKKLVEVIANSNHNPDGFPVLDDLMDQNDWQLNYEVCFYRDLLKSHGEGVKNSEFPDKRTWDLALFSKKYLIIIEAKAHENLDRKQLADLAADKWGCKPKFLSKDSYSFEKTEFSVNDLFTKLKVEKQDRPKVLTVLLMPKKFYQSNLFDNLKRLSGQYLVPNIYKDDHLVDYFISWESVSEKAESKSNKFMLKRAGELRNKP
jgi:hypothetical protein